MLGVGFGHTLDGRAFAATRLCTCISDQPIAGRLIALLLGHQNEG